MGGVVYSTQCIYFEALPNEGAGEIDHPRFAVSRLLTCTRN